MSRKEKLLKQLLSKPRDFTFSELTTLLTGLGYELDTKGKTSGSRVAFIRPETKNIIRLHKPHPGNILKAYQLADVIEQLKTEGSI